MVFLREGLDKIMFTIREDDYTEYPYDKDVEMKYADRIQRLKFAKRWGNTIFLEKHPWQSWKHLGEYRHTYALQYFMRIDGMRQMRVLLNCQRLYNIQNNLMLYDKRLFDDNVVLPSVPYTLLEFVDMVKKEILLIKEDYIQLRDDIFGDKVFMADIVVDTHQIEIVQEGIGVHTSDISETFKRFTTADLITVYHDQINTHYLNTTAKRQLKMYQKGVAICRLEATLNLRPNDIVWGWQDGDSEHITRSLQAEFDDILLEMKIPTDWYKIRSLDLNNFTWGLADAIGLRSRKTLQEDGSYSSGEVQWELMKVLLHVRSWKSDKDTASLTRTLVRKGLLEQKARGYLVPSNKLLFLQELYERLKRSEKW